MTGEKSGCLGLASIYSSHLHWATAAYASRPYSKGASHLLFNPTSLVTARCGSGSLYKLAPVIRLVSACDSITMEFQVHRSAGGL